MRNNIEIMKRSIKRSTAYPKKRRRFRILIGITLAVGTALAVTSMVFLSSHKQMPDVPLAIPAATVTSHATPENDLAILARESAKKNDKVIGWIRIEGTRVDYPVVQTTDNVYYLKRDAENKKNVKGAIFLEYHCDPVSLKGNNILFGHHMNDGSMFATLVEYSDAAFFNSHPIIKFATLEKTYEWEIFSVFVTSPSYDYLQTEFADSDQYLGFITTMQRKSIFKTDITLSGFDDIIVLSTCTYDFDDARFVVAARRTK